MSRVAGLLPVAAQVWPTLLIYVKTNALDTMEEEEDWAEG